jgi:transcription initiation factor TFIIIB Brf1 subunit/transcription initiation factor TFIIB
MSEFELYNQAIKQYNQVSEKEIYEPIECTHEDVIREYGQVTCATCGEEIKKDISHEKEWSYNNTSGGITRSDPSRVQIRKTAEQGIYKDVESFGFSKKVIFDANELYINTTKGKIFRAATRKAIIFACIFHVYKINNNPQPHGELMSVFDLSRGDGLKGIKYVGLHAPKGSPVHTGVISPSDLTDNIITMFNGTDEHKETVRKLYKKIHNKSSLLNQSQPRSVAAGLVYYWIDKTGKDIDLKEFASKTSLSTPTILRMSKEICKILD